MAALQTTLILAENARAFLEQHDATIVRVDIPRDDAGGVARHGAVHRRLQDAGDNRARGDEIVAIADHAGRGGADRRRLLERIEVGPGGRRGATALRCRIASIPGVVAERSTATRTALVAVVGDQRRSSGIIAELAGLIRAPLGFRLRAGLLA